MSKTILLVDDEPHVLEVLKVTLEDLGFRLLEAVDGPSAISVAQAESPDLVVLDVMLPNMSGLELCRTLKESVSEELPIIMLTARSGEEDARAGLDAGADRYLTKPFSPLTLMTEVVRLLNIELP